MKKLLVTGASGFLGWNLCQLAQSEWEVYGVYGSQGLVIPGVNLFKADLRNFQDLKTLFAEIKPAAVIHTAAKSKPNYCQTHPEESYAVNVEASLNIAGLCADYQIPCAFTSTDLVFDGLNPPYQETDAVSPVCIYGEHKLQAEQGMLARYPKTAVCRMPLMFGMVPPTASTFIQPFLKAMRAGEELKLFTDEIRTAVSGTSAAKGLLLALAKVEGVIHLGGKESMSRYDFGQLMAQVWGLSKDNLKPCLQEDVPMAAPRSPNTSMDSSRAFALGYQPLSMREELEFLRDKI